MTVEVAIRDFRPGDRAHLARCLDSMQDQMVRLDPWHRLDRTPDHSSKFIPHLFREVHRNDGFVLVAEANGERVGVAVAWIRRFSAVERTAEAPTRMGFLSDLAVLPEWRGRGVGSHLLAAVEQRFRQSGCDQTSLGVFYPNLGARRLYRRLGYSERGLWMAKRLADPPRRWPREGRGRRKRLTSLPRGPH